MLILHESNHFGCLFYGGQFPSFVPLETCFPILTILSWKMECFRHFAQKAQGFTLAESDRMLMFNSTGDWKNTRPLMLMYFWKCGGSFMNYKWYQRLPSNTDKERPCACMCLCVLCSTLSRSSRQHRLDSTRVKHQMQQPPFVCQCHSSSSSFILLFKAHFNMESVVTLFNCALCAWQGTHVQLP